MVPYQTYILQLTDPTVEFQKFDDIVIYIQNIFYKTYGWEKDYEAQSIPQYSPITEKHANKLLKVFKLMEIYVLSQGATYSGILILSLIIVMDI